MKTTVLFPAFFLALSLNSLFAQKQLPPSLRPQAANWTYTLVKSLHDAGFDMPTLPAHEGVGSRGVLQLDSTKLFYGYDQADVDSLPLFRSIYQYPQPRVTVETHYQFIAGNWEGLSRFTNTNDDQDRRLESVAESFDVASETFEPSTKINLFPRGDSPEFLDSVFIYGWEPTGSDWTPLYSIYHHFDAQDRLVETIAEVVATGAPLLYIDRYAYDDQGDNKRIESFAVSDGVERLVERKDLVYVDHLPIEMTIWLSADTGMVPSSRTNYAYTVSGLLRRQMNFEWKAENNNWRLFQTTDFFYDMAQRLSGKEKIFIPVNAWDQREYTTYAYVDGDQLRLEWVLNWDHDLFDWILTTKKLYYYNGLVSVDPEPGAVGQLLLSPNPSTGLLRIQMEEAADVQVFNSAGQLVASRQLQSGEGLDLTQLPAGLYRVAALGGGRRAVGNWVKQ
ncbi:MAG: T9SS type A sorting domain-containing protein [Saprospiraceae bacterium]|nr:T9SS type A sorting domain-containing protein [Saprospiraceae bacterium]